MRRMRRTYYIKKTVIAIHEVGTAINVSIWEVRELNEDPSGESNGVHDRGGLRRADIPKVMGEREDRPPVANIAELLIHRVV